VRTILWSTPLCGKLTCDSERPVGRCAQLQVLLCPPDGLSDHQAGRIAEKRPADFYLTNPIPTLDTIVLRDRQKSCDAFRRKGSDDVGSAEETEQGALGDS
jgi:hypothetical protein